jgi:hypothetical protein
MPNLELAPWETPEEYGNGYANEPDEQSSTGAQPVISDGAIVDQAHEPDDD